MTANSIKSSKAFSVFKDSAICIVVLTTATLAGYAFKAFQLADADIIMLYIIAVLVISIFTSKMYFCLISSLDVFLPDIIISRSNAFQLFLHLS